jgi:hypothetical protein
MACKLNMLARVGNCPDCVEGRDFRRDLLCDIMWLTPPHVRHDVSKVVQNDAGGNGEVVGGRIRLEAPTEGCREFVDINLGV